MITMADILEKLTAALEADTALTTLGNAKWGTPFLVQEGIDPDSEAELNECPAVAVMPAEESGDAATQEQPLKFVVQVEVRVRHRGAAEVGGTNGKRRRYDWTRDAAAVVKQVRKTTVAAFANTNLPLSRHSVSYAMDAWPVIMAGVRFEFEMNGYIHAEMSL